MGVNLPHSWNAIDGQDGGNDYFRGTCYYAKTLDKMDLPQTDRYYLELQGSNSSADVYLNGMHLAHRDGGSSTWRVDITDTLTRNNLFVIAVNNVANDKVAGGFEMNDAMMSMLGGFTILRLSGMIGTMGVNLTKEDLLELNAKLNKIKKD
jgi:hypothetical protein